MRLASKAGAFAVFAVLSGACSDTYETFLETLPDSGLIGESDAMGKKEDDSSTSWSQSGQLNVDIANTVSGLPLTTNGKPVSCQANWGKQGGKTYTVMLGVSPPVGPLALDGVYFAEATVTWTVDGTPVTRVVSLSNGQSIQGQGEAVHVVVRDITPLIDRSQQTPQLPYNVTIAIAPGPRGSNSTAPTLTPPLFGQSYITQGGTLSVPVPANSGVISVNVTAAATDAIAGGIIAPSSILLVRQVDAAGTVLRSYSPNEASQFVPLHPLCAAINIVNMSTVVSQVGLASVIFGIDG